jgi:coenzyme F420-reducing hydrogenase delta subunit/quinol-cytochrome oxidoreductase complex cytochrome b subunit
VFNPGVSEEVAGSVSSPSQASPRRFPYSSPASEPFRRRALRRAGAWYQWGELLVDRLVSSPLNPLYHTGTIAIFSLAVATITGIYLFIFYRVGTDAAHRSIEGIMAHPLWIGALMRSLHRYSSDAAILAAFLHGGKMLLNDRFWGARWIGWVTGLALLALVWITGATGYWLVWDMQAQWLSISTARFLDFLPIFGEPLARTFLPGTQIQNFLFFIVLFIHITIPLLLGLVFWLHVVRLARARFFPPRLVLLVTSVALIATSLGRPALSGPPADLSAIPGVVPVDLFYFFYAPLTHLEPWTGWAALFGIGLAAFGLPWALKGPAPERARVESPACTGCMRCWKDCPYEAIVMVPRNGDSRYKLEAVVNPAKCVGCGICIGACDSAGILLGDQPVSLLGGAVKARLSRLKGARPMPEAKPVAAPGEAGPVLVYACRIMTNLKGELTADGTLAAAPNVTVMGLPCVGMLHPEMIEKTLAHGAAGVFVAGCIPEDCYYREGSLWLAERLEGKRQPSRNGLPEGRLKVKWYSPVEVRRFVADVRVFSEELSLGGLRR